MKSLLNVLGWILFLVAVIVGLVFYNAGYVPVRNRLARQQEEIGMWTREVESLRRDLESAQAPAETAFVAVLTFAELFKPDGFGISKPGEASLRGTVTMLQKSIGVIEITGHTDGGAIPKKLRDRYPSRWLYAAAASAAVARGLEEWGVASSRLVVRSAGSSMPRGDSDSPEGRMRNRRVEILVCK